MIYTHNNQWRSTILIDGTAEAKLADVLLIEEGKIRSDKPTNKQNGKWFCNAADVLKFAIIKRRKPRKNKKHEKNDSQRAIA